nr:phosphatase PAP2 family protein [Chloroflexota bacterium]
LRIVAALRDSYSFPSGHVTYAVAFFGLLLYLSFQVRSDVLPAVLWVVRACLALIILLMPVSRMLEGEHWPSDVAGAAFFGGFWLLAAIQVDALVRRRSFPPGAER